MAESIEVRLARIEEKQDAHHAEQMRRLDQINGRVNKHDLNIGDIEKKIAGIESQPKPISPIKTVTISVTIIGGIVTIATLILKAVG